MKQKRVFLKPKPLKYILEEEIKQLRTRYESFSCAKNAIKLFQNFPFSQKTLRGLGDAKYVHPTFIQRESIGPALLGKDIIGTAITGSGKTLAFLIPILEHLYMGKWSRTDGIAAVIISPTRELAYQIFETVKKIGKYHDFSVGLIIGGKNLKFERSRMDQCNILICTPGRLLQHMDVNPLFNASTTEVIVLDEADRCLDMGFEPALNAIIENFPPNRQILLFSATLTSSVNDLARLNLKDPVYIGQPKNIDDPKNVKKVVPDLLQQNYIVIELEDKMTMLWSFIKNHLKQKILVFFSSCKQVKYVYEVFCKLRPGISLLALYGTLHQDRRICIYNDFVKKSNVVLFATDIASRGLDFPGVNWVVQLDCPEDVTQYIHRAGRSARNKKRGESLLVLLPSEEGMIDELNSNFLTVHKIQIDPKKLFSPAAKIGAFLAQNQELKSSAQRAFVAYIKSVFLMKNKKIFNVLALNFDYFAKSLGLVVTPRVRFLNRYLKKQNDNWDEKNQDSQIEAGKVSENGNVTKSRHGKLAKYNKVTKNYILFRDSASNTDIDESDEDFIKIRSANHRIMANEYIENDKQLSLPVRRKKGSLVTKAALAKKVLRKKLQINEIVQFDEEGHKIIDPRKQFQSEWAKEYESKEVSQGGIELDIAKQLLQEEDQFDKKRFRELVKQRHKTLKKSLKQRETSKDGTPKNQYSDGDDDSRDDDYCNELSWHPDPTAVYNKDYSNGINLGNAEIDFNRKHVTRSQPNEDIVSRTHEDDIEFMEPLVKKSKVTSTLTLNDAEVIATQLLANSM